MNDTPKILPDIAGVFCLVVFLTLFFFAGEYALRDGDTLWHIRMGAEMLERGSILTQDLFSHTAPGKDWTAHEWLAEVVMAGIHSVSGLAGVVTFYFLIASLTFWVLFRAARRQAGDWLALCGVSAALTLSMTHLLARPHLFSWLLGVITLYLLQRGGRGLLFIPLLMIFWVNLHGGFVLGLALQVLYLAANIAEKRFNGIPFRNFPWRGYRYPFWALALSLVAVGLNPFGYEILLFPFHVSKGLFRTSIGEWLAPNLQQMWYVRAYILLLLFFVIFARPRISWANGIFALFFLNAAFTHARHVSIAGLFLTPFFLESLAPWRENFLSRRRASESGPDLPLSPVTGPVVTLLLGASLILLIGAAEGEKRSATAEALFPLPEEFSPEVVRFIEQNQPEGNLFNQDEWGDYLLYAMDSPPKLFVDGRLDMYGEKILEDYLDIREVTEDTQRLLRQYDIGWVLFPPSPLTRYLHATGEWEEVFRNDQTSILVRREPARP